MRVTITDEPPEPEPPLIVPVIDDTTEDATDERLDDIEEIVEDTMVETADNNERMTALEAKIDRITSLLETPAPAPEPEPPAPQSDPPPNPGSPVPPTEQPTPHVPDPDPPPTGAPAAEDKPGDETGKEPPAETPNRDKKPRQNLGIRRYLLGGSGGTTRSKKS